MTSDIHLMLPEIFLSLAGLALLLCGLFQRESSFNSITLLTTLAFIMTGYLIFSKAPEGRVYGFDGLAVVDGFSIVAKYLILIAASLALLMTIGSQDKQHINRFEFPILILFSTLGLLLMVSNSNLLVAYVSLELSSLSLYILAALARDRVVCVEAGLKYFTLSALASGLLLYGISIVYGFAGSTDFTAIGQALKGASSLKDITPGLSLGLVFILSGFLFKVSAAPFHMWTPDVYEGAPTSVTAFYSSAPKVAAFALFFRFFQDALPDSHFIYRDITTAVAVLSMLVGAFGAIRQTSIKRLLAYSSIGHAGYMLIAFVSGGEESVQSLLIYLFTYIFMTIGAFACVLYMQRANELTEKISDLCGFSRSHPKVAFAFTVLLFSMAGIPPLAGFFGKYYVFLAAVKNGYYVLVAIGFVTSVVAAYYYIKVVKVMYFDEATLALQPVRNISLNLVLFVSTLVTIFFIIFQPPLLSQAQSAASTLYNSK